MLRVLAIALAITACKKAPTAESCGTLVATIDGKPLATFTTGLAKREHGGYEVGMFNMAKTTCADFTSTSGRTIPEGEISVEAWAGGEGLMNKGVVYDANTVGGTNVSVSLLGEPPKAKGDKVQICVNDAEIEIGFGANRGKKVRIAGLFEGTYCGN